MLEVTLTAAFDVLELLSSRDLARLFLQSKVIDSVRNTEEKNSASNTGK